ncbi:hypothetical protein FOA52_001524 [Chlamydomonas sp. UWO 241]|nr:hypothetical protein FOA52_001524 [Chlamydomonas sp. UWO 241]
MSLHRFATVACLVATVVWYLNFDADGKLRVSDDESEAVGGGSGSSAPLAPVAPNRAHVLVTGGAGYIGSHAALALLDAGHTVTVLDNLSRGSAGAIHALRALHPHGGRLRFVRADLGVRHAVEGALQRQGGTGPRVDVVMHFAAVAYVGESMADPLLYYRNITANTITLLEAMAAAGVSRLVYSSTCAVYGDGAELPITEDTVPRPTCPYGEAKLMAENVIRAHARSDPSFSATILRYFNVIGSDPDGRLGEYPRPELRQHARISGACVRDYIHVADLVAAHLAAMGAPSSTPVNPPAVYNVATGRGVSVRAFVDACRKVTGVDIKVVEQAEARPGDYSAVWADPAKINRELGWAAVYSDVESGLSHAWAWRRKHPHGHQ